MSFVKLYGSILDSSVWGESHATVRVWIAMLAMADADGIVTASHSGLKRRANVSAAELAEALGVLQGPDGDDSSGIGEGERIIKQQGGWVVVNHRRYRDLRTAKQMADAERQAEWRAQQRAEHEAALLAADSGVTSHKCHKLSPPEAEAEANAYTEAEAEAEQRCICDIKHSAGSMAVVVVAGCPIHAPATADPLAEALAAAIISTSISQPLRFAEQAIGSLSALALNLTPDVVKQAVSEALADTPDGITDEALRRKVRAYVKQAAKTPPGERDARERAASDAALPPLKRLRCRPCKDKGVDAELVPQMGSRTMRMCSNCHRVVSTDTERPRA